ncbi:MAG: CocE/NonD family hydrolase, partial [Deltaproteobacteria bacterium]
MTPAAGEGRRGSRYPRTKKGRATMTDGAFRSPRCWRRRVRSLSMGVLLLFLATAAPLCRPRTFTEMVLMRDGMTHLATKVFLPPGEGPWPVVLIRTPYDKEALDGQARSFTEAGIAVVAQDIRGRYASEGTFRFFLDDGWGENADGYDTLRWISEQSWNDGRVCSWGGSAVGITQYLLAGSSPPGFTCLGSIVGTGDLYHGVAFQGGAFRESLI